jgi:hypothetical protein
MVVHQLEDQASLHLANHQWTHMDLDQDNRGLTRDLNKVALQWILTGLVRDNIPNTAPRAPPALLEVPCQGK